MKDNSHINDLIIKAVTGEDLTAAETVILDEWLTNEANRNLFERLKDHDYLHQQLIVAHKVDVEGDKALLLQKMALGKRIHIKSQWKWKLFRDVATSAAAVLVLAAAIFLWLNTRKRGNEATPKEKTVPVVLNDRAPGQSRALLTLANGSKMVLDSTVAGQLTQQGGVIVANANGTLSYKGNSQPQNASLYNTLSTSNGETYAIVLSDGSKAWLNTGASIRYPVAFTGSERKVEITGEVYFEVAHQETNPFIVHVSPKNGSAMDVQVLGTHFNIKAYDDEAVIKTTLLEGSVKVTQDAASVIIKPGEQASLSQKSGSSHHISVQTVDVDAATAWKNGQFSFDHAVITDAMAQLAKWYDIEVVYEGPKPTQLLVGETERNVMLSQVLKKLEYTGIRFRIEGKKLVVMSPNTQQHN